MINVVWRRSLLDVKVKRSADIGSDHHLVTAYIKIKLRKTEARINKQARFDTQRLRDSTVKAASISYFRNRFQILQDISDEGEETSVNNTWTHIGKLYTESSIKKLCHRKRNTNKERIQQETNCQ
jgi:hypothetical protein